MFREMLRSGIAHVGLALRDPEEFSVQWNRGDADYRWWVWGSLVMTAVLGTFTYGMTMGFLDGPGEILRKGLAFTLAAGLAWLIPLPTLYILNSLSGSRLPASSTLLAALVTVSWGGLALIASIPIIWFFTAAIPYDRFVLVVNLLVFLGVGVAMADVFLRVMRRLEPDRRTAPGWFLVLLWVLAAELNYSFKLLVF